MILCLDLTPIFIWTSGIFKFLSSFFSIEDTHCTVKLDTNSSYNPNTNLSISIAEKCKLVNVLSALQIWISMQVHPLTHTYSHIYTLAHWQTTLYMTILLYKWSINSCKESILNDRKRKARMPHTIFGINIFNNFVNHSK